MPPQISEIFNRIHPPSCTKPLENSIYTVMPIPTHTGYFVGKDKESLACLFVSTSYQAGKPHPPIRLKGIDVQFDLHCNLKKANEPLKEGIFTVIRCRARDSEMTSYFLSICGTLLSLLGDQPTQAMIAKAVIRLAAILQKVQRPPTRPINGLFGELYLLLRSSNAVTTLRAWRDSENARFDFTNGKVRLDVKATIGRNRVHTFSYEQCNPPSSTIAVAASLHIEQIAGGLSLCSILDEIKARVYADVDLMLKLDETVAATLGTSRKDSLSCCFDMHLADSSLQFFNLEDVPAIRGPIPIGVSDVHFRSDLSSLHPVSINELIDQDPIFWDLLPSR